MVWMLFLPRRWRIVCFLIVTPWEIGVILTANYTFLNYLVLALGFLLLDDRFLLRLLPSPLRHYVMSRGLSRDAVPISAASPSDSELQDFETRSGKVMPDRIGIWLEHSHRQLDA